MISDKAPSFVKKKHKSICEKCRELNFKIMSARERGDYNQKEELEIQFDRFNSQVKLLEELYNEPNLKKLKFSNEGKQIGYDLANCFRSKGHKYTFENFYLNTGFECDVLTITKSNRVYEYEVKTSISDFKADFKKESKHKKLSSGTYPINHFYYVCPNGLLTIDDIPKYAGLMYGMKVIKKAPLINKEDHFTNLEKIIATRVYWYWRNEIHQNKLLRHKLDNQ